MQLRPLTSSLPTYHFIIMTMPPPVLSLLRLSVFLNQAGIFAFACKSTKDPECRVGETLRQNFCVWWEHARHFYTEEYAKDLVKDKDLL